MTAEDAGRLALVKLSAVASSIGFDAKAAEARDFPFGAGLVNNQRGALYVVRDHIRTIGPTLLWMQKHQLNEVDLIIEGDAGIPARRAQALTANLRVWQFENQTISPAQPAPHLPHTPVSSEHEQFADLIEACGADPIREHGILTGEVLGLEVCRVVDTPNGPRLEVGVGAIDRETFQLVHSHRTIEDSLKEVAALVRAHRSPGAPHHPLGALAGERRMRHQALLNPALINAATLQPAEPPVPRTSIRDSTPCVATGTTNEGTPLVAVFTDTVDVDIIGFGVDAIERENPAAELAITTYTSNLTPSLQNMAEAVSRPIFFTELSRT